MRSQHRAAWAAAALSRRRVAGQPWKIAAAIACASVAAAATAPAAVGAGAALPVAHPNFTIVVRQEIAGSKTGPTAAALLAQPGQTVDYEITFTNTGNVPLTFGPLLDEACDGGTIEGGSGETPVPLHGFSVFTCTHLFTEADKASGALVNAVTDAGAPPEGDGAAFSRTSNSAIVRPRPAGVSQQFGCTAAQLAFYDFPNGEGNEAHIWIRVAEEEKPARVYKSTFAFTGPSATDVVPLVIHSGAFFGGATVTGTVTYSVGGVARGNHRSLFVSCVEGPHLGMTLEKLQRIAGGSGQFTTEAVTGRVGDTVDYEIVATDTGNLTETAYLEDKGCDEGTLAGGPERTLEPGASTTYTCDHRLTAGDAVKGTYSNTANAFVPGFMGAIFPSSNTVVADVAPELEAQPE